VLHGGPRSIRAPRDGWGVRNGDAMAAALRVVIETDSGGGGTVRALRVRVTVQAGQVWEVDADAAAL
jgi:hypothetical protein